MTDSHLSKSGQGNQETTPARAAGLMQDDTQTMTPEARKVVRDAKRGLMHCKTLHDELSGRIQRLEHLDHMAAAAASAEQLKWLLRMMQAAGPAQPPANCNHEAA